MMESQQAPSRVSITVCPAACCNLRNVGLHGLSPSNINIGPRTGMNSGENWTPIMEEATAVGKDTVLNGPSKNFRADLAPGINVPIKRIMIPSKGCDCIPKEKIRKGTNNVQLKSNNRSAHNIIALYQFGLDLLTIAQGLRYFKILQVLLFP